MGFTERLSAARSMLGRLSPGMGRAQPDAGGRGLWGGK